MAPGTRRRRLNRAPGQQVGLLETIGAKSGKRRRCPLLYLRDGDHVILIASKGGNPRHPAWYWNLKRNPRDAGRTDGRVIPIVVLEPA
jgi:deazaflavin-dependent oxidoreductase (nitroreductase family)